MWPKRINIYDLTEFLRGRNLGATKLGSAGPGLSQGYSQVAKAASIRSLGDLLLRQLTRHDWQFRTGCWQVALVLYYMDLSKMLRVLRECSHDMAAGFLWNEQVKREPKKESTKSFMT